MTYEEKNQARMYIIMSATIGFILGAFLVANFA